MSTSNSYENQAKLQLATDPEARKISRALVHELQDIVL